jgi:hypothetical protein
VSASWADGQLSFTVGRRQQTVWYEIVDPELGSGH